MGLDFEEYPKSFLLAGLFVLSMLSFAIIIAGHYGQSETLVKSDKIDFTSLENQINQTSADAVKWGDAFRSDNLFVTAGAIVLFSLWGIGKLIFGSVLTFATIFLDGASSVIGISPLVIGVVTAILIISLIFALWRVVKQGS